MATIGIEPLSKAKPVLDQKYQPLSIHDIEHLFIYKEGCDQMPFRPKGGEVYIYRPNDEQRIKDWVADGHNFSCEGTKKVKGRRAEYKKYYNYLHI